MKIIIFSGVALLMGISAVWFFSNGSVEMIEPVNAGEMAKKQPVLVELFTSEGCSSCPPADRVLTTLQNDQLVPNAEVITLAFHVDYWNYLGWKDKFSTAAFSKRQEEYARKFRNNSSYTPQMVVDGTVEFVGSNRGQANQVIAERAAEPKPSIDLVRNGDRLSISTSDLGKHAEANVILAITESKLITDVKAGENRGEKLEHTSVVRQLVTLGKVKSGDKVFRDETEIPKDPNWKTENLRYVVFVQESQSLKVLAVSSVE